MLMAYRWKPRGVQSVPGFASSWRLSFCSSSLWSSLALLWRRLRQTRMEWRPLDLSHFPTSRRLTRYMATSGPPTRPSRGHRTADSSPSGEASPPVSRFSTHSRGGSFGLGRFPATSTYFAGRPTAVDLLSGTSSDSFRAPDGCTSTRPMVSYRILGKLTVGSSGDSRGPRTGRRLSRPRTPGMQSGTSPPTAVFGWIRTRPHGAIAWTGRRTVTFSHLVRTRVHRSTTRSAMNGCTNLPVWNGTSEASHGLTPETESRLRT